MATLINNAGVQHYANKMVLAENRKVGSKSLPTALADIDNLIDEMKTQFDAEYGSALDMKLENNENAFSVGTGSEVDKRSEVENSFTDVELSGNSLVNLCKSKVGKITFVANGTSQVIDYKVVGVKPATKYTIITTVTKNTINHNFGLVGWLVTDNNRQVTIPNGFLGVFKGVFTTSSSPKEVWNCDLWQENTGGEIEINNITLLEGDWTNKPIPDYFEGLKSVGEHTENKISISSVGKNLLPIPDCFVKDSEDKILINVPSKYDNIARFMNCKKVILSAYVKGENIQPVEGTSYHYGLDISLKGYGSQLSGGSIWISLTKGVLPQSGSFEGWYHKEVTFQNTTTITGLNRVNLFLRNMTGKLSMSNIQLEIVDAPQTKPTHYQPYILDKKEILLNEPLRALSDEVKDSIEKINGEWKIVRRCGEIVLNGSENWGTSGMTPQENTLIFQGDVISQLVKPNSSAKSDKFATYNGATTDAEGLLPFSGTGGTRIYFRISKSKLSSQDVAGFKQWLSQNPTKVIYELATPIIEDVSPITLQCWKNGTISIDEILPVETTHTVALNKPAQIKRNIEELTVLRKRVQALEDFYDQIALEQAHQLSLINHSIELDYDI